MAMLSITPIDAVGVGAALCSMASFVPQIAKLIRERDASGISLRMFSITTAGFVLWTAYGFLIHSWPIAASNAINLALAATILTLKLRYGAGAAAAAGRG
jgi:MtN3 and saliva related transmembrane protein